MSLLPLNVATWDYDRVRAIIDGRIAVEGCDVNYFRLPPEETFFRAFAHGEFEVAELSLSSYMIALSRGDCPYTAIPVFPSRSFRHSAIYVRTDRGIRVPTDLRGRTIGVPEYQMTAALWARGILAEEYGLGAEEVEWRSGGLEQPGRHEKLPLHLPSGIRLKPIETGRTLSAMLDDGELDGLITARTPSCFMAGCAGIGRLFEDYRAVERAYFLRTGIFPIMHVIGVHNDVASRHPWVATNLMKAFSAAKDIAMADLHETAALKLTLPWVVAEAEDTRRAMGADFWPYGIEANRKTLEAALGYSHAQGLLTRRLTIEDMFIPNSLAIAKI